jgi:hypothetical protein
MPFNNIFYVKGTTVNAVAASLTIEYWDGQAWREAVDLIDGTSTSGAPFAKSGLIQFQLNRNYGWLQVSDTSLDDAPSELQTLNIRNCYWIRIKSSATMTTGTIAKEISYAFTSSQELQNYDIEINNFYDAFFSGKADWVPEILTASKLLVLDLKSKGMIDYQGQIIELDDVYVSCSYKALEIIYFQLGKSYDDKRAVVQKNYQAALSMKRFTVDSSKDARIDEDEQTARIRKLER